MKKKTIHQAIRCHAGDSVRVRCVGSETRRQAQELAGNYHYGTDKLHHARSVEEVQKLVKKHAKADVGKKGVIVWPGLAKCF